MYPKGSEVGKICLHVHMFSPLYYFHAKTKTVSGTFSLHLSKALCQSRKPSLIIEVFTPFVRKQ